MDRRSRFVDAGCFATVLGPDGRRAIPLLTHAKDAVDPHQRRSMSDIQSRTVELAFLLIASAWKIATDHAS